MDKIGIVYATMTKHSAKLATAIGRALRVSAQNVKDNPAQEDVDLLFIIGGLYSGESRPELLAYVRGLDSRAVRRAALVTSCVTKKHGQDCVRAILKEKGIEVAGEFLCQGNFLWMGLGHPNKADMEEAARFASRIAGKESVT